jgi:DNA polymerase III alpha subunit
MWNQMHSNLTVLKDRLLLPNGISVVEPEQVPDLLLRGLDVSQIQVTELTKDVQLFNERSSSPLEVFDENAAFDLPPKEWLVPQEYLDGIDLKEFFAQKLKELPEDIQERAEVRIANELVAVREFQFEEGLKTIIYVVNVLRQNRQVWGVGRGSSCASYLLFLVGIHCVDCLKYNIHWSEFFHS